MSAVRKDGFVPPLAVAVANAVGFFAHARRFVVYKRCEKPCALVYSLLPALVLAPVLALVLVPRFREPAGLVEIAVQAVISLQEPRAWVQRDSAQLLAIPCARTASQAPAGNRGATLREFSP